MSKYLGEAGSRRCMERVEVDEMGEIEGQEDQWAKDIVKTCLDNGVAGAKLDPVCDWTSPKDEILEKNLGPDGFEEGNGVPEMSPTKLTLIAALVAALAYYWYDSKVKTAA